ncbi:response regulator [Ramlibacter sp.]|uniref:response regulator n=1 Tax=Ramlibacter sp. TaxID=1917967 RepID=UPI003D10F7C0
MTAAPNRRVLLVDDMPSIHEDFGRMLAASGTELSAAEAALFGEPAPPPDDGFELHSAYQGEDGLAMASRAVAAGRPYAVGIIDMRMPPGWNGVETIEQIWRVDPELQVILCTAYSDMSWDDMFRRVRLREQLTVLRKPFDPMAAYQLILSLASKWDLARQVRERP